MKQWEVTSMKFNKKYKIAPGFESLFAFKSKQDELEHEAKMIMFRFLSEVEKLHEENPFLKKDLAQAIGTSASYITQLYNGNKLINLITLAKLQDAYDFVFEIKARSNSTPSFETIAKSFAPKPMKNRINDEEGLWVFISNKNPNYDSNQMESDYLRQEMKVVA